VNRLTADWAKQGTSRTLVLLRSRVDLSRLGDLPHEICRDAFVIGTDE
jgi:hypothetical protein